ncbi:gamma-aminobutyric acid receptor subunit alpha-6-like [Ptychodera flava]|uniref:gamma-aminobutyric acid receptor subunit alpha-6-like n=1 Tax=Ptychodera flava TaxID=63121 RepID=UPI00396AA2BC
MVRSNSNLSCLAILTVLFLQMLFFRTNFLVQAENEGSGDGASIIFVDLEDNLERARQNLSRTLDRIVNESKYDKSLRPGQGGAPVLVEADIYALSIGPVVEVDMEYHLDVFFRQRWKDPRLAYSDPYEILSLNTIMLESIWYPDTYFHNGKKSYGHTITTPNRLFRIYPDGTVLYTQRLTIISSCNMYFENYPMDRQVCSLVFGSNSFSSDDVIYHWHKDKVKVDPNTQLSQFELIDKDVEEKTIKSDRIGDRSVLIAYFHLKRHLGYFMIQIYVPCILITVLSWVSFWLNPEATPARVALGVMTILNITTLGWSIRDTLPKVSYAKALDWYLALCFTFVLGSLIEFAGVNYFSRRRKPEEGHRKIRTVDEEEEGGGEEEEEEIQMMPIQSNKRRVRYGGVYRQPHRATEVVYEETAEEETCCSAMIHCLKGNARYRDFSFSRSCRNIDVAKVDRTSRVAFPSAFAILNLLYWVVYLSAGGVPHVKPPTAGDF